MMRSRRIVTFLTIVLLSIALRTGALSSGSKDSQHLPKTAFGENEYNEYPNDDDQVKGESSKEESLIKELGPAKPPSMKIASQLDPNIVWDAKWGTSVKFGQISGVSITPEGNVAVFHRGQRVWGSGSFDMNNKFDRNNGAIQENTIVVFDKSGEVLFRWGSRLFYLPHGLTVDHLGNYWITDVAMHQVFKFDAEDIEKHKAQLDVNQNSIIKPSITLGQAFIPGNDENSFCKPTAVAVQTNGDFFVSDGYCNSRIIKYNAKGEKILQWGRSASMIEFSKPPMNTFLVPHALALDEELNYLFLADRENGRLLCFLASNGEFHKEYKSPLLGPKIFSVAFARKKIYLVNGGNVDSENEQFHKRGFVIESGSGKIVSQFGPNGDMDKPHDIAVSKDGREIYVIELNSHKVYRFLQGMNNTKLDRSANFSASGVNEKKAFPNPKTSTLALFILMSAIVAITFCLGTALVVARCRKRARRRMDWDVDKSENFKLSSLLDKRKNKRFRFFENRPNTRDFNKLSTEPETSDDENMDNNLSKLI